MSDSTELEKRRIYVGGLFPEVQSSDLREKFSRFGAVDDIQIKVRKDEKGTPVKTFAYLNINGHKKDVDKCFSTFNRAKWKGSMLVLQNAKENFLAKLEKEREEADNPVSPVMEERSPKLHDPLSQVPGVENFVMRGAVPGTPIPGEKNWIVGKYGRVLPIVHLKKSNKRKMVRVDPSKLCHNLKKLKEVDDRSEKVNIDTLTWDIDDKDSEMTKKRKGEFSDNPKKSKSAKTGRKTQMVMEFLADRNRRYAEVVKEANDFEIVQHDGKIRKNLASKAHSIASSGCKEKKKTKKSPASKNAVSSDFDVNSADTDEIIASTKTSAKKKTNVIRKASQNFQDKFSESSSDSDGESGDIKSSSFVYVPGKKAVTKKSLDIDSDSDSESDDVNSSSFVYIPGKKAAAKKGLDLSLDSSDSSDGQVLAGSWKKQKDNDTSVSPLRSVKKEKTSNANRKGTKSNKEAKKRTSKSDKCISDSDSVSSDSEEVEKIAKCKMDIDLRKVKETQAQVKQGSSSVKKTNKNMKSPEESDSSSGVGSESDTGSEESADSVADVLSDSSEDSLLSDSDELETSDSSLSSSSKVKNQDSAEKNWMSHIPEFKGRALLDKEDEDTKRVTVKTISPNANKTSKVSIDKTKSLKTSSDELETQKTKCISSEDPDSAASADTDEILSSFRQSKDKMVGKANVSAVSPSVTKKSGKAVVDEFACGFLVNDDKIVYPSEVARQDSGTESDGSQDYFCPSERKSDRAMKEGNSERDKRKLEKENKKSETKGLQKDSGKEESKDGRREKRKSKSQDKPAVNDRRAVGRELPPLDKHADDNRRRLDTLKERKKEIENKKALVQRALAQVDLGSRLNKKIVFDSDDDVEEDGVKSLMSQVVESSLSSRSKSKQDLSSSDASTSSDNDDEVDEQKSSRNKKQLSLFDSSNSDDEDMDKDGDEDMFRIRPQYEGDKGKKLMELQSRFGNDDRFRIDERFVDSDDEGEETKVVPEEAGGESERSRSLRILEDVVGRQPVARLLKQENQRKMFKDVSTLHFDPTRAEHSEFEIKAPVKEKVPKKKNKKKSLEVEEPEVLPEVGKERSYDVSSNIQDAFKKSTEENSSGFSLLAAFGKKGENSHMETRDPSTEMASKSTTSMNPWDNRFSVDSSDVSSNEADDNMESSEHVATEKTTVVIPARKFTFFFCDDDNRLKEGVNFFRRPDDFEAVVERWRENRPKLIESYKEKLRKAVKNKRKLQLQKNPVRRFGSRGPSRQRNEDR